MTLALSRLKVTFDYTTAAFLCAAVIMCSDYKFVLAVIFTVLHEAGHIIAMLCLGSEEIQIHVNLFNVAIKDKARGLRSYKRDIAIICAGPSVNIVLFVALFAVYNRFGTQFFYNCAMLNLALGVFNLLPFESTDGGQLLYIMLCRIFSLKTAHLIMTVITVILLVPVAVLGFCVLLRSRYNYTLLFAAVYLMGLVIMKKSKFFD